MNEDKDELARLLRAAGRRPEPSADALARMRSHVHGEWQAGLAARRRRRYLAVAASLLALLVSGLFVWNGRQSAQPQLTARIASGGEFLQVERRGLQFMTERDPELLGVGDRVSTGAGRGALLAQLPGGTTTLRLDRNTVVEWVAHGRLRLLSGRLYVDTGLGEAQPAAKVADALIIEAADTLIRHVGTQFTATLAPDRVVVGVRDGTVQVAVGSESANLARGESATVVLSGSSGTKRINRGRLATSGESWHWADELAPRLPIEGRNLVAVLRTLAYQAGLTLEFASERVEADALSTTLHGPVLDMAPDEALRAILATTSFRSVPPAADNVDHLIIDTR